MSSKNLESLISIRNLGVYFDTQLAYDQHIELTVNWSLRMLGYIKRHVGTLNNIYCFRNVFVSLVRSIVEYNCIVWSPFYQVYINGLEKVPNRLIRFCFYKLNILIENIDYNKMRTLLNISTLKFRRIEIEQLFMFKLLNGSINCSELLANINFHVPGRITRHIVKRKNIYIYLFVLSVRYC